MLLDCTRSLAADPRASFLDTIRGVVASSLIALMPVGESFMSVSLPILTALTAYSHCLFSHDDDAAHFLTADDCSAMHAAKAHG